MQSIVHPMGIFELPLIEGEFSMIPFDLETLRGLVSEPFCYIANKMLEGIESTGTAYLTIHGKKLKQTETLRRGAPHTDGNYEPVDMMFGKGGGNGWKVGENGPRVNTELHKRQYYKETGGIIIISNYESCWGWLGEYYGLPGVGGDCSHIELDQPFMLLKNQVYYGNNHFIHESLPVLEDVHRVFARITMPEDHIYQKEK